MESQVIIRLNGNKPSETELTEFVDALSRRTSLTSTGGYLFKSIYTGSILHIGFAPAISGGNRLHHYDIGIPEGKNLLGSISATGELSILFKAESSEQHSNGTLKRKSIRIWREQFVMFAQALISNGYSGAGNLDWITRKIIEESGLFHPIPDHLKDLSIHSVSE